MELEINKLTKHLRQLLTDKKQSLADEIQQEVGQHVNYLQKRLTLLQGEKVDLEHQLEIEQEYIANKLQKVRGCLHANSGLPGA